MTPTRFLLSLMLLTLFVSQATSVTYTEYIQRRIQCNKDISITKCITNPLANATYDGKPLDPCALGYYQSQACLVAFSKCPEIAAIPSNPDDQVLFCG